MVRPFTKHDAARPAQDLARLLDTAKSEAKRRGHKDITAGHLVAALLKDHSNIASSLGEDVPGVMEAKLRGLPRSYDEPQVTDETWAILRECEGDDSLTQLASRLSEWVREPAAPATPVGEGAEEPSPPVTDVGGELPQPTTRGLIPDSLSAFVAEVQPDDSVLGRDPAVRQLLTLLRTRYRVAPLVIAAEGAGRTALLGALAAAISRLPERSPRPAGRCCV